MVTMLLMAHAALLGYSATQHSPTSVESSTMAGGLRYWRTGSYDVYIVNPPFVPVAATLPVVFADPRIDWTRRKDTPHRPELSLGSHFAKINGERGVWLFTLARWACIPLSLIGALVCFLWARELHGPLSGILAVTLWCFSPSILGHGQLASADVAAASTGVLACYGFWHWLKSPSWRKVFFTGLALGLAELTKTTWSVLFGLWLILWILWAWADHREMMLRDWLYRPAQLGTVLLTGLFVLNLGYGFEKSFQPLGKFEFVSKTLGAPGTLHNRQFDSGNRFRETFLGALPVPLPENYTLGIDLQKQDFQVGHLSYLNGQWRFPGWWYYYLYAFGVKVPLGTLYLLFIAIIVTVMGRGYSPWWRDEWTLLLPGIAVFILVSSQTGMNHHFRYVLPAFPFLIIWTSKVARCFAMKDKPIMIATVFFTTWLVGSSLWCYPHSLSYFNEFVSGPKNGGEHLLNSNIDWGQDVLYLKDWLDEHPGVMLDGLVYHGSHLASLANIPHPASFSDADYRNTNRSTDHIGPKPGWYALSVNSLYNQSHQYRYFLDHFEPVASAGYSIYIYHITLDEANRVRLELGLPEIEEIEVRQKLEEVKRL